MCVLNRSVFKIASQKIIHVKGTSGEGGGGGGVGGSIRTSSSSFEIGEIHRSSPTLPMKAE